MNRYKLPNATITGLEISDLFFNMAATYEDENDVKIQANDFLNSLPSLKRVITATALTQDFFDRL